MANKYIGDYAAITTLQSGDEIVINQASDAGTKKITFANLVAQVLANILANNGTTATAGTKALDAAYGKTLKDSKEDAPTVLTATLTAGQTSLTFSNAAIKTTSLIDIYANVYGIAPTAVSVSAGQAILTFAAQQSNISVKLLIR